MKDAIGRWVEGRVVVITGASRGIGAVLARRFAEEGACLGLLARNAAHLEDLAGELSTDVLPLACDVADEVSVADAFARIARHFGAIDSVVANAGIASASRRAHKLEVASWNQVLQVNLTGAFLTARAGHDYLAASARGRLVTVSSVMGRIPRRGICAYAASKAGVEGLTRALAVDWATDAILVNAVAPGFLDIGLGDAFTRSNRLREQVLERTLLGRFGKATDLANAVIFLAGDGASDITGQILRVDGGYGMG